jgi:hypothetical protein
MRTQHTRACVQHCPSPRPGGARHTIMVGQPALRPSSARRSRCTRRRSSRAASTRSWTRTGTTTFAARTPPPPPFPLVFPRRCPPNPRCAHLVRPPSRLAAHPPRRPPARLRILLHAGVFPSSCSLHSLFVVAGTTSSRACRGCSRSRARWWRTSSVSAASWWPTPSATRRWCRCHRHS